MRQVAVAVRILVKVVLVILFCSIEILQRQFLYGQGLLVALLLFCKDLLDDGQITPCQTFIKLSSIIFIAYHIILLNSNNFAKIVKIFIFHTLSKKNV